MPKERTMILRAKSKSVGDYDQGMIMENQYQQWVSHSTFLHFPNFPAEIFGKICKIYKYNLLFQLKL